MKYVVKSATRFSLSEISIRINESKRRCAFLYSFKLLFYYFDYSFFSKYVGIIMSSSYSPVNQRIEFWKERENVWTIYINTNSAFDPRDFLSLSVSSRLPIRSCLFSFSLGFSLSLLSSHNNHISSLIRQNLSSLLLSISSWRDFLLFRRKSGWLLEGIDSVKENNHF